jgi:hypothetical protein
MATNPVRLTTPGVIAAELGVPLHRVTYVLATRPHIRPAARAGVFRLYNKEAVTQVRQELEAIAGCRPRRRPPPKYPRPA